MREERRRILVRMVELEEGSARVEEFEVPGACELEVAFPCQ